MPLNIIENLYLEKPSFGPSKWPQKLKPAKNSKLPKWPENCFEPFGKGGWPPISTWINGIWKSGMLSTTWLMVTGSSMREGSKFFKWFTLMTLWIPSCGGRSNLYAFSPILSSVVYIPYLIWRSLWWFPLNHFLSKCNQTWSPSWKAVKFICFSWHCLACSWATLTVDVTTLWRCAICWRNRWGDFCSCCWRKVPWGAQVSGSSVGDVGWKPK